MKLSANLLSVIVSLTLAGIICYFFFLTGDGHAHPHVLGLFDPTRVGINLAWLVMLYCFVQFLTSALTMFSNQSWFWAALDICCAFVPVGLMLVVFANPTATQLSSRAEEAGLFFILALGTAGIRIVLTLIVNRRFGFLAGSTDHA